MGAEPGKGERNTGCSRSGLSNIECRRNNQERGESATRRWATNASRSTTACLTWERERHADKIEVSAVADHSTWLSACDKAQHRGTLPLRDRNVDEKNRTACTQYLVKSALDRMQGVRKIKSTSDRGTLVDTALMINARAERACGLELPSEG